MISLSRLNVCAEEEFVAALGGIYEHSDWIPRGVVEQRPFSNIEALGMAMRQRVENASEADKLGLIRAHPDLAGKLAKACKLTEESTREQAGLGLDRLQDAEYEQFQNYNDRYRERFGFPFVICARLTTKSGVLEAFERRLDHSCEIEIAEALKQIHEIARLRLEDLIEPCL
jgi:2-oxo-4-hydroxy-4-carboxy-5-ureidoimidazoline decarboxylase